MLSVRQAVSGKLG